MSLYGGYSDRFADNRTYSKKSTDVKQAQAKKSYNLYNKIYDSYAKAVNVTIVDDKFKSLVNEFRSILEIPANKSLNKSMKDSWIEWYNRNK